MATLKDRIDKAVSAFEVAQKAKEAVNRATQYNTTVSKVAKIQRELKNQSS